MGGVCPPLHRLPRRASRGGRRPVDAWGDRRGPAARSPHRWFDRLTGPICRRFRRPSPVPTRPTIVTSLKPLFLFSSPSGHSGVVDRPSQPSSPVARVARCASSPRRKSSRASWPWPVARPPPRARSRSCPTSSCAPRRAGCELAATDMELSLRVPLDGHGRGAGRGRAAAPRRRHRADHGRRADLARAPRQRGRGGRLGRRVVVRAQLPPGPRLPGAARRRGLRASRSRPTCSSRRSTGWRAPPPATRPARCSPASWCGSAPTGITLVATDSYRLAVRQTAARRAARRGASRRSSRPARCTEVVAPGRRDEGGRGRGGPHRDAGALPRSADLRLTSRRHRRSVPGPPPARAGHASSTTSRSTGPSCSRC